ncbi:MAG: IgGFc-binding protein [Deltaproteobacteria bacterium]|nr:IgGFc-binding protein [Deltaproteobacteria bacterium]
MAVDLRLRRAHRFSWRRALGTRITSPSTRTSRAPSRPRKGAAPSLDVLAAEDGTEVTILPKTTIYGNGAVQGSPINEPITYKLDAGQYVQITQPIELTGSPIQSNKPVAVWGGSTYLNVLPHEPACDSAHQQIPPVKALGTEYALVRYRNRKAAKSDESTPFRLVGAVDGTKLTWKPMTPPGGPKTLAKGQVYEFIGTGPYLVSSQDADHPFYAAQYMTGATHISPTAGEGDPEWVNVVPTAQFLDSYVFFTDPTYPETSLVVVRKRSAVTKAFADVTLACAGKLGGWLPVGAPTGDYEYTRVDLVTGDFENVGACSNGRQQMSSSAPFGVTVWGWGGYSTAFYSGYVSYAYPAGASIQPINEVVVPPTPN